MKENKKSIFQKIAIGLVCNTWIFFSLGCKAPQLSARIELRKDTLILGEEFQWNLIIKNESKTPISIFYDSRGNYHNALYRDSDLKIVLKDSLNTIMEQIYSKPHDLYMESGRVGFEKLKKGQELKFQQWFTDWYQLDKAGNYTLEIEKPLMCGKSFLDNKILKIKSDSKLVCFYPQNPEERIKIIRNLENQYRSKSFKSWEEGAYILGKIIRSKDESSLDFYVELLNSRNSSSASEMIRAIGKLSPSQKAFQVLVNQFDMGFENVLEDTEYVKNNKESIQQDLYFGIVCEMENFPPEMTVYFLNKVAASDQYGESAKWRARQIMQFSK
jgi:hypothetical protein